MYDECMTLPEIFNLSESISPIELSPDGVQVASCTLDLKSNLEESLTLA